MIRTLFVMMAAAVAVLVMSAPASYAQEAVANVETIGDVDLSQPGTVRGRISRVGNQSAKSAVGKYLEGSVQIIQNGARINWQTMTKSPGSQDAMPVAGLSSVAQTGNAARISSGSRLLVSGNPAALIRAAGQLGGDEETTEEKAEDGSAAQSRDSSGLETSSIGGGNETKENSLANPPQLQLPETTAETVTVATDAYGTTTDGCEPVLSDDETKIIIMQAPTKNGEATGPCVESLETAEIKTSYVGCEYDVREDELTAYAEARRYYTYGANTTYLDDDCEPDEEMSFEIFESPDGCQVVASVADGFAQQYTKLVFLGRRNEMNLVGDCAARTGEQFAMIMQECEAMRDDFAAGVTWVRERPMYELPDGRLQAAGECADAEEFFVHQKDYSVCDAMPDYEENKLYPQYRIRIAVTGSQEYRTAVCQPDTQAIANLEETGTGCESFHNDYDGYSLGGVRIVRTDTGSVIRECAEGAVRYEHQREAQGWQRDDANLQAFPAEAVYITLPQPAGKTYIEQAVVRGDAEPQAYSLVRTYLKNTDVEYVSGSCDAYQNRDTIQVYERPDGTEYEHNAGAASPLGPNNACSVQNSAFSYTGTGSSRAIGGYTCDCRTHCGGEDGSCSTSCHNRPYGAFGQFAATHALIREDGATIDTDSATREYQCGTGCGGASLSQCPSQVPNLTAEQFYIELGWN